MKIEILNKTTGAPIFWHTCKGNTDLITVTEATRVYCVELSGADMEHMNLTGINVDNMNFSTAYMHLVVLAGSSCHKANFGNANLRYADFTGSNLSYADFTGADISGANFTNADCTGANFTNVKDDKNFHRFQNANFTNAICAPNRMDEEMRTNNEDIFYEASSLTGVHINKWGDIPIDVLVEAWKQALAKHGCVSHTNAEDALKSAWQDFIRCDKDRSAAFDDLSRSDLNCVAAANLRYTTACDDWANTWQWFVDIAKEKTGNEPIWDVSGCTLSNGEHYKF
jgi:uncharacterized protein YjbI with pentapeptide repeats